MNPVRLELLKIDRQWYEQVKAHTDKPLFVCLGEKHTLNMFDVYFKSHGADEVESNDVFLVNYKPFEDAQRYGAELLEELHLVYKLWREHNLTSVPCKEWNTDIIVPNDKVKTDAGNTAKALIGLYESFPPLRGHKIFILLSPQQISSIPLYEQWLFDWCANMNSSDVKIVVLEKHEGRLLKKLPNNRHEFVLTGTDIASLMNNVAAQTAADPNDEENVLQQQMLLANVHFSRHEFDNAHVALAKAIAIASRHNLKDVLCTAHLLDAYVWLTQNEQEKAHDTFRTLLSLTGEETLLSAQMHVNYGGFLLAIRRKEDAIDAFEKSAEIAKNIKNPLLEMECYRIMGQIQDGTFTDSQTIAYYEKCIEIGMTMNNEERQQSSLAYIATLLLKKYGNSKKAEELCKQMEQYLGADWQTNIQVPNMDDLYHSPLTSVSS
ncbi:hypothetical protein AXF23_09450 [Prevotella sp. oral taxon 313]|jgi:hypothetical protein|uniref:tetratricopeptide repeat protein n=1 Tax=Prevotella TaxID=838 RepID=UPI000D1E8094|nr:hypothetical protein [Prevotella sp. oral taxon 313]PTL31291.1 hypothetical protein AXF23_09450 [Prevotella sp. oral taxon 313]